VFRWVGGGGMVGGVLLGSLGLVGACWGGGFGVGWGGVGVWCLGVFFLVGFKNFFLFFGCWGLGWGATESRRSMKFSFFRSECHFHLTCSPLAGDFLLFPFLCCPPSLPAHFRTTFCEVLRISLTHAFSHPLSLPPRCSVLSNLLRDSEVKASSPICLYPLFFSDLPLLNQKPPVFLLNPGGFYFPPSAGLIPNLLFWFFSELRTGSEVFYLPLLPQFTKLSL